MCLNAEDLAMGLKTFAVFSNGDTREYPKFFKCDQKSLAKAQRKLSDAKKGIPEYGKRKRVVQHIHQRIKNRRDNFSHQLSREVVNKYQIIALENLNIQNMQDGNWRSMNRSIGDVAWRNFVHHLVYKAENAGRTCVLVDPRNTTQLCSGCGEIVKKDLSERMHKCPNCDLVLDRDENAARNILARGMASLG